MDQELLPNAVLESISDEECEQIYYDLCRYLGLAGKNNLTKLYIMLRQARKQQ